MERRNRAALALGSGGARGYAHIGAIQVLEERGIDIVAVAGTSMGALIGGLHAAGKLKGYTDWVRDLTQFDVMRMMDISFSAPGVIRAEKVFARLRAILDGAVIEDLPIPFTAVATDLYARKAVWLQRGPLDLAIRASISIPGVFAPVMVNGRWLVDGGMIDPVPIAATASSHADLTIAIDLGGARQGPADAPGQGMAEERPIDEWFDRFRRGASHLIDRDLFRSLSSRFSATPVPAPMVEELAAVANESIELPPVGLGKFDVMHQSLEAMQSVLTRYRLAGNPPDLLVSIPTDACRTFDFHRASDMIELGRTLTTEALDAAKGTVLSL